MKLSEKRIFEAQAVQKVKKDFEYLAKIYSKRGVYKKLLAKEYIDQKEFIDKKSARKEIVKILKEETQIMLEKVIEDYADKIDRAESLKILKSINSDKGGILSVYLNNFEKSDTSVWEELSDYITYYLSSELTKIEPEQKEDNVKKIEDNGFIEEVKEHTNNLDFLGSDRAVVTGNGVRFNNGKKFSNMDYAMKFLALQEKIQRIMNSQFIDEEQAINKLLSPKNREDMKQDIKSFEPGEEGLEKMDNEEDIELSVEEIILLKERLKVISEKGKQEANRVKIINRPDDER